MKYLPNQIKSTFRHCFWPCLVWMVSGMPLLAEGQSKARVDVSMYLKEQMQRDSIPGLALGLFHKGDTPYIDCMGSANLEDSIPVQSTSTFQIASVTKQFTAVSMMLLVRDGKVRLDDPVRKFIPEAPLAWQTITLRHLLSHSSGLMNYEDLPGFEKEAFLDSNHAAVLKTVLPALYQQPLRFPPGQQSQYCNTNYFLLGVVLERVTGINYEEFIQTNLLHPLGLTQTTVNAINQVIPGRVAGYSLDHGQYANADRLGMNWFFAEGNLLSTVKDLTIWCQAFFLNSLLHSEECTLMTQPVLLSSGQPGKFGLGWFVDDAQKRWVYHSGHTPGFASFVCLDFQSQKGLVLLMNTDHLDTEKLKALARQLLNLF